MTPEEFMSVWNSLPDDGGGEGLTYGPPTPGATELFIGGQPETEPSFGKEALNVGLLAGQGVLGNFLDEIAAVPSTAGRVVGNVLSGESPDIADTYAQEQKIYSDILKQAATETPVMGTISEIGGAVISPLNKILPGGGLFKKVIGSGVQGAIGGFGAGDSLEDRAAKGILGAGIGSALTGATGITGKVLRGYENILKGSKQATELAEVGLTPSAIKKSALRDVREKGTEAKIIDAAKRLIKEGDITPGEALENQMKLEVQSETLGESLGNIYAQADAVPGSGVKVSLDNTLDWIKNQKGDLAQQELNKMLKKEMQPFMKTKTISFSTAARNATDLAKESKETLGMEGTDPRLAELKKYISLDLRKSMDKELAKGSYGELGTQAKQIKGKLQDIYSVLPALVARSSRDYVESAKDRGLGLIRTSGGIGSLLTGTALATGGVTAPLALGALAAPLFATPGGRQSLANASEKAASLAGLFGNAGIEGIGGSRLFGGAMGQVLGGKRESEEGKAKEYNAPTETQTITPEQFRAIWDSLPDENGGTDGSKKKDNPKVILETTLDTAGITDPKERAQFLGQMAHESANFSALEEIGSGKRYEGRKDLGNTEKGDGSRFKGRGFIQLTGRANYQKYGDMIGVDLISNPELAADPEIAAQLAVAYWQDRVKTKVKDFADTRTVTRLINGGYNGLSDRMRKVAKYMPKDTETV